MRRTLLLGSVAAVAGSVLVGCGGSSSGTNLNNATRIAVGYVYVRQNNWPQASPSVIVSQSSIAPSGYAAPDAGTVTMTVPDGTITRSEDTENFNMSTSNVIVARVYSQSSAIRRSPSNLADFSYPVKQKLITQLLHSISRVRTTRSSPSASIRQPTQWALLLRSRF